MVEGWEDRKEEDEEEKGAEKQKEGDKRYKVAG